MTEKKLMKLVKNKTDLIDAIIAGLEARVLKSQSELLRTVIEDFVDKMDIQEGRIMSSMKNKRLIAVIDEVYAKFTNTVAVENIALMIKGVQKIMNFNNNYFQIMAPKTSLVTYQSGVKESINSWLGITSKGKVKANGYISTLLSDSTIKNEIRNQVADAVITQAGYSETKSKLKDYIDGKPEEKTGAMQKYYRNFVYDTFSHVDRANSQQIAEGVGFNYAIYEGGIIKTTRKFCRNHNGKVYSREEIAEFDPIVAKPPGYNPFLDLGGYACRHHLNWIPDALAKALRPDLNSAAPADTPPAAIE